MSVKNKKTGGNRQISGMMGVYYVAAELSKRGYTAVVTTRNTKSFDIVAVNEKTGATKAIEVKTCGVSTSDSFWLLGKRDYEKRPSNFIYVFVKVFKDKLHDFYVAPADYVAANIQKEKASTGSIWYSISKTQLSHFKEKWGILG
jgi:hypothetical protein